MENRHTGMENNAAKQLNVKGRVENEIGQELVSKFSSILPSLVEAYLSPKSKPPGSLSEAYLLIQLCNTV